MKTAPSLAASSAGYGFSELENQFAPEADLITVARGDFSKLSAPLLVACRDHEQFEEFCFREGLICSEVRRIQKGRYNPNHFPASKILLLLPEWWEHPRTDAAVNEWVKNDRYTVALRGPRPVVSAARAWVWMLSGSLAVWVIGGMIAWWMIFK